MIAFDKLQSIGKALMMPVAVLPVAAVLLRLGADDAFDIDVLEQAGKAIFDNLPIIFSMGIAFGLAKDAHNNGAAALAGFVCYSVLDASLDSLNPEVDMGVLAGILSGIVTGALYNRFYTIRLPEFLGFFAGRRFVPIIASLTAIVMALVLSVLWPPIQTAIELFGETLIAWGSIGTFVYGVLNRLLIPLGLHHILNNLVWFTFGEYVNPVTGAIVRGDLTRFFAGDPNAGIFMAGGFPVMMFGLPAVALAMYRTAKPENRPKIAGALLSMALTSFLTGITEPIEFSFMFLAPALYVIHAVFMGLSMFICYTVGVLIGCSFSMGFIDYVLNWGLATRPELIIPIGIVFGLLYYVVFSQIISSFDLPTLGRFEDENFTADFNDAELSSDIIKALGGGSNLETVDNCVTRLRITVRDPAQVDEQLLKSFGGVNGILVKGTAIQIIVGLQAEQLSNEINSLKGR